MNGPRSTPRHPARLLAVALALAVALPVPARALELVLPRNAEMTHESLESPSSHAVPTGAWKDGALPLRELSGQVLRQAWRIQGRAQTTLQLLDLLTSQIEAQGMTVDFACAARACGGFDFRFAIEVIDPPAMEVDLFDYRFLAASRPAAAGGDDPEEVVTLLVSRSGATAHVQIVTVGPEGAPPLAITASGAVPPPTAPAAAVRAPGADQPAGTLPLADRLERDGHVVLADLAFASGSAELGDGEFASLAALAAYLAADPVHRVALVGHTDAVGSLDANVSLSRRRASSVMRRLIDVYGVPARQLEAGGMGYLAPRTSNRSAEGREANRRVEAVLLDTE